MPSIGQVLALTVALSGCHHTFIDLNPDAADHDVADALDAMDVADATEVTEAHVPPLCGNGIVDAGEGCDDGNRLDLDSCRWDCTTGPGPAPGPADPSARPYRTDGPPMALPAASRPPGGLGMGGEQARLPFVTSDRFHMGTWPAPPAADGTPAAVSARFLALDGSLARDDVVVSLSSGWAVPSWAAAAHGTELLVVFRAGSDGIFGTRVSAETGMLAGPSLAVASGEADSPALTAVSSGYVMAWFDGSTPAACVHDTAGPDRVYLGRLHADGSTVGLPGPRVLEEPDGAHTAPALATGDDFSVGLVWWRASPTFGGTCTMRVGVADQDLAAVADGGVIGPGWTSRIVFRDGAYRFVWLNTDGGHRRIGFGALDREADLLGPPAVYDLPIEMFMGEAEVAAGDHELVAVIHGYAAAAGHHLLFMVTDLLGQLVAGPVPVDTTCESGTTGCWPGPFNIVRTGEDFLVIYFATTDPGGPAPVTEMRVVRLVPAS